jgi:hypothetical protein
MALAVESQTLIVKGRAREGRTMFVAPRWRGDGIKFSVKQWNPLGSDGLRVALKPLTGEKSLTVLIGADRNSHIKVNYQSPDAGKMIFCIHTMLKKKCNIHSISFVPDCILAMNIKILALKLACKLYFVCSIFFRGSANLQSQSCTHCRCGCVEFLHFARGRVKCHVGICRSSIPFFPLEKRQI